MNPQLHQRLLHTIRANRMLRAGDAVGAGVSGGADSIALLLLLEEVRAELGIRLLVLHFNHQLRGADSDADEQFVAGLASQRGLQVVVERANVTAAAREYGWNLEDAARRLRYEFFSRVVNSGRASRIAVAHTADDQAETLLAHLLRGTGPTGLAAIYPVAGHVVRPLLDVRREQLRSYLTSRSQPWREDPTNADTSRLRARIRQNLLPQLEHNFQPAVVARLCQLAELAREDEIFWSALLDDRYEALVERASGSHSIQISDLLAPLPLARSESPSAEAAVRLEALTRRLVRRICERVKGDRRQLTARHVAQVIHLATACSSGHRVHLPGILVERSFDRLVFSLDHGAPRPRERETALALPSYEYEVDLLGRNFASVSVPEIGRRFRLKVIDWPSTQRDTTIEGGALDIDRLRAPLVLRSWRPGDSYRPQGRRQAHKLKRLLLESRVALRDRQGWPVLTSAGELAWVRGLPVAEEFAPQADTKAGLLIVEESL